VVKLLIQADRRGYAWLIQPLPAGGGLIQVLGAIKNVYLFSYVFGLARGDRFTAGSNTWG